MGKVVREDDGGTFAGKLREIGAGVRGDGAGSGLGAASGGENMVEQQRSDSDAPGEAEQRSDYYVKLRARFRSWAVSRYGRRSKWAEYLLFAPDLFHLLCKLTVDPDVPVAEKAKLATAIAYFVSPLDLLPEIVFGPVGFVDDIAVAAYVLDGIVNKVGEDVVRRHWVGDEDVLAVISRILAIANRMVGSGLWAKLRGMIG